MSIVEKRRETAVSGKRQMAGRREAPSQTNHLLPNTDLVSIVSVRIVCIIFVLFLIFGACNISFAINLCLTWDLRLIVRQPLVAICYK